MPTLITNSVQIERFANALYGVAVGSSTMAAVNADIVSNNGLTNTLNNYYSNSFGTSTTASVAASIVANVGIVAGSSGLVKADVDGAVAYVKGILDAATPGARGAAVTSILNTWGSFTADKTYGAAATTWNALVDNAIAYSQANFADVPNASASTAVTNAASAAVAAATAAASAVVSTPLTVGTDTIVATKNALSISGTAGVSTTGAQPTFTAGDSITGLSSVTTNALNVTDQQTGATWTPTALGGVTITGIQNVTFSSGEAVTVNTTKTGGTQGYSGLTSLGVYGAGGLNVTTDGKVAVTATDNNSGANNEVISGGSSVNLTVNGITTGAGSITVGSSTAAPQGAVTVTTTQTAVAGQSYKSNNITIIGGTTETVNQTLPLGLSTTAANYVETGGNVTITGQLISTASGATATNSNSTGTTSASVTQSRTVASTFTVNLPSTTSIMAKTGAAQGFIQISDGSGNSIRLVNATGGNLGPFTANQIAQAFYAASQTAQTGAAGDGTASVFNSLIPTGVTVSKTGTMLYSIGAPSIGGGQIVMTATTTAGATQALPTFANDAIAATVSTFAPTITAATGGTYDGVVTISDANGSSSTAVGTLNSVTLNGLSADANGVGTVLTTNTLQNLSVSNAASGSKVTITNNLVGTASTTLNLTVNGAVLTGGNLVDTNAEITSLNITTSGSGATGVSTLGSSTAPLSNTFANVQTMTINGSGQLNLGTLSNITKLASLSISGGASVSVDVTGNTSFLTSIVDTATGQQVVTIDPRTQSFNGTGSGQDIITIAFPATVAVTGSSATNNQLVWNGANAPTSLGSVTGFSQFVIGGSSAGGSFNMTQLGAGFNTIGIRGGTATTGALSFTNVTPGTALFIDQPIGVATTSLTSTQTVNYTTTGTTGSANSLNLNLGVAATDSRVTARVGAASGTTFSSVLAGNIILADAAATQTSANGIGTLNVTSSDSLFASANSLTQLTDSSLSTLNISGTGGLTIGTLANDVATSLTINNTSTSTAYSSIRAMTDNNLNTLNFTGTGFTGAFTPATGTVGITQTMAITDASNSIRISNTSTNPVSFSYTGSAAAGATGGPGLTSLNLTGSTAMTISALTDDQSNLAINSTDAGLVTLTSIADTALSNLTISGTGPITISGMSGTVTKTVIDTDSGTVNLTVTAANADTSPTFMNTGTGIFNVTDASTALVAPTLIGNVAATFAGGGTALTSFTVVSDNANITLTLGTTAQDITSVSMGNGNNSFTNIAIANQVTLGSFGSGSNTITLGTTAAATGLATGKVDTFTFAPHAGGNDRVILNSGGADAAKVVGGTPAPVAQYVFGTNLNNGLVAGDTIQFGATNAAAAAVYPTSGTIATIPQFNGSPTSTLAATINAALLSITIAGGTASFIYGGNTYLVSDTAAATVDATDAVILITGLHTFSANVNGVTTLLT